MSQQQLMKHRPSLLTSSLFIKQANRNSTMTRLTRTNRNLDSHVYTIPCGQQPFFSIQPSNHTHKHTLNKGSCSGCLTSHPIPSRLFNPWTYLATRPSATFKLKMRLDICIYVYISRPSAATVLNLPSPSQHLP